VKFTRLEYEAFYLTINSLGSNPNKLELFEMLG